MPNAPEPEEEEVDPVEVWRALTAGKTTSWVLFEYGTVVMLPNAALGDDLAASAKAVLREWGPVHAGTDSGDFNVLPAEKLPGWIITCYHPDILNYMEPQDSPEFMIGLFGRGRRDADAQELTVVHVEDRRPR
jgi:hypothetical protein